MRHDTSVTLGRETVIQIDYPRHKLLQRPFILQKTATDIARQEQRPVAFQLTSRGIQVVPKQWTPEGGPDRKDSGIIEPDEISSAIKSVRRSRRDAPPGSDPHPDIANEGNPWMVPAVEAGKSWDTISLPGAKDDEAKHKIVPPASASADKFGWKGSEGREWVYARCPVLNENAPIIWRILFPDTAGPRDTLYETLSFGGPIADGDVVRGPYALRVTNNGRMALWERIVDAAKDTWEYIADWSWVPPAKPAPSELEILIQPQKLTGALQSGIAFVTRNIRAALDKPSSLVSVYRRMERYPDAATHLVHTFRKLPQTPVTGAGPLHLAKSARSYAWIQASRVTYPALITIVDDPFILRGIAVGNAVLEVFVSWTKAQISNATIVTELLIWDYIGRNWKSVAPITVNEEKTHYTFGVAKDLGRNNQNSQPTKMALRYTFMSSDDGTDAPVLQGVTITRGGTYEYQQDVPKTLQASALSLTIGNPDLLQETGSVVVRDVAAQVPELRIRGRIPITIDVRYDPTDPTKTSNLFQGYILRAEGVKKSGSMYEGMGEQGGGPRLYPSPDWRDYRLTLGGIGVQLKTVLSPGFYITPTGTWLSGTYDPANPGTLGDVLSAEPAKVTDVCRTLLATSGCLPLEMIDIPDSPVRVFPNTGAMHANRMVLLPGHNVLEYASYLLQSYLGWVLLWDGNAGPRGMLRAIRPQNANTGYNNLCSFTMQKPLTPGVGHIWHPGRWGNPTPYWVGPNLKVPIQKGTWRSFIRPPEANIIGVVGSGGEGNQEAAGNPEQTNRYRVMVNPSSYDFFQDEEGTVIRSSDPLHPDYLGECVPAVYVNIDLSTKEALEWATRRIYDVVAHAIVQAQFVAPLVLVQDPNDPLQTRPRPLRYYDAVLIDGTQWLIQSCTPTWQKDAHQWALYEVEAPRI